MNEVLVTLNLGTVTTALVGGLLLGFFAINETVETALQRWLVEVRIHELLRLVPLLLVIVGTPIVVTFWVSAILTDLFINAGNDPYRAGGRGMGHLLFLWSTAVGAWLDVHYRRRP
jgi:hypothetical protein